jgi:hypothetical protein
MRQRDGRWAGRSTGLVAAEHRGGLAVISADGRQQRLRGISPTPTEPSAPALLTATARLGVMPTNAMPAWAIGVASPYASVNRVCSIMGQQCPVRGETGLPAAHRRVCNSCKGRNGSRALGERVHSSLGEVRQVLRGRHEVVVVVQDHESADSRTCANE